MFKHPSPNVCPFGDAFQKYWDKRYEYFERFDEGIQTDAQGLHSVVPEVIALREAAQIKGQTVLDGFTGIGGCAIALARAGKQVTTVEIDPGRLKMARNNAAIYGVEDKITFIQGDILDVAPTITADAIILDPPWGGLGRERMDKFLLKDFMPDGNVLLELALQRFNEIMFKVPPNFDRNELQRFNVTYTSTDGIDSVDGRLILHCLMIQKR